MSGIQPSALSNKELLQASYLMWKEDAGMPVEFQKEMMRRFAILMDYVPVCEEDPRQMSLFDTN